ncbi:MAG: discoidin domain-containing protein [Planctomycetota bacterium]|jgi:hypothetical protein
MCRKLFFLTSFVLVLALAGTNVVFGDVVWEGTIAASLDDVEEGVSDGGIDSSSSDLELPYEGTGQSGLQVIGIRFPNVTVPRGAAVTNAYVEFMCDETKGGTEHVSVIIGGDLSPDAAAFSSNAHDVTNRPQTTAQVVWDPVNWTSVGELDQTVNIAPVIQEIISQPGWVSGNALVIVIRDNPANPSIGIRCAEAEPGDGSAMLHIEWSRKYAKDPNPEDGQTDVPRDLVCSWTPGEDTATVNGHKVYFSENFDDVKNGIGGITLSDARYVPAQDLAMATTYYWRVDEVTPDNTVYEGKVWSFTTELFSYPIENVTVTASSTGQAEMGPENTINGSGLDDNDLHSTDERDMWLSGMEPLGAWIQFEFDNVCKLLEMWVWNSNQTIESLLGFGLRDVTVEYSTNGTDWTTLAGVTQFAQAPGTAGYQHNITIDFGGAAAKYVKVTATSNWGGILPQYGLSEVRFVQIPVSARVPNPDSGATGVPIDVVLDWAAGREGVTHDVHFGDDRQAVIDSTTPVATVTESSHGPLDLDLDKTYYWRVDEVNEAETPTTWPGGLWSFTTTDHLVVDDFESYNDFDPAHPRSNRIFNVWIDGFEVPTNGSLVGYENPPFAEQTIVHGGMQSMPFFYSNTGGAASSEAELTLSPPQNWTKAGVATFVLYFHGTTGNTGQLYVKVNGSKVVYDGDAADIERVWWQPWNIDLASSGAGLQSVTKLAIGIDGNGAAGTLYFDDIGLYMLAPAPPAPVNEWRIADDADDAEETVSAGGIDLGSSDLEMPYEGTGQSTPQIIGVRFTAIPIPKGATITDAWVRFQVDETKGGTEPVNLIIKGELSANPATFSSTVGNISSRPTTTAQVQWSVPNWTTVGDQGPDQTTPSIASIIQEIVNQDGWAGSAIVLMFRDNPANPSLGVRCAEAGPGSDAALLYISYQ